MLVISMLAMWAVTASFLDEYKKCAVKQGLKKCTKDADCGCPTQECVGIFEGYKSCVGCPDSVIDGQKICAGLKTGCQWDSVHKKCGFKINGAPTECVDMRSKPTCSNKDGCVWKKRKCQKYVCPDVNTKKCESIDGCTWNMDEKKCELGESKEVVRKDTKLTKMCRKKRKSKAACERAGCVFTQVLSKREKSPRMIESCIPKPDGWTAGPTVVTVEPTPAPTASPSLMPTVVVTPQPTHLPTVAVTPQPTHLPTTLIPTTPAPTETSQPTSGRPAPPPPSATERPTAADIAVSFDVDMCKSKVTQDKCKEVGCIPVMKDDEMTRCKAHELKCSSGSHSKKACESLGDDKFMCQWMPNATREKKRCVPKK